jgi:hypothetical protein
VALCGYPRARDPLTSVSELSLPTGVRLNMHWHVLHSAYLGHQLLFDEVARRRVRECISLSISQSAERLVSQLSSARP